MLPTLGEAQLSILREIIVIFLLWAKAISGSHFWDFPNSMITARSKKNSCKEEKKGDYEFFLYFQIFLWCGFLVFIIKSDEKYNELQKVCVAFLSEKLLQAAQLCFL